MLESMFIHPSDYAESKSVEDIGCNGKKDILMIYCPHCQDRLDVEISHPRQSGECHQAINLLPEIATTMTWERMDVVCKRCLIVLDIEPVIRDRHRVDVRVKIDCEGIKPGQAEWYKDGATQ